MKILIVDDHDLFAEGLKLLIENLTHDVEISLSTRYETGLQSFVPSRPFDLILLDYRLPDAPFNSIENFCTHVGHCPVVVISSEDSRETIRMAINAGASGYIPKSSSKEVLLGALEHVLNGGTFVPTQVLEDFDPKKTENENISTLTQQQKKVLSYIVKGVSNKVIANHLDIAEGTVKAHLHKVYKMLGVKNRTEAVLAVAKNKTIFDD